MPRVDATCKIGKSSHSANENSRQIPCLTSALTGSAVVGMWCSHVNEGINTFVSTFPPSSLCFHHFLLLFLHAVFCRRRCRRPKAKAKFCRLADGSNPTSTLCIYAWYLRLRTQRLLHPPSPATLPRNGTIMRHSYHLRYVMFI